MPFFLGEITVTRAEIMFNGCRGFGMTIGDNRGGAYALALYETFAASGEGGHTLRLFLLLEPAVAKCREKQKIENYMTAATKVEFEVTAGG